MRIAFDATTLRPFQSGIGYYTEHLLRHLVRKAPECEFVLISNREVEPSTPLPPGVRVEERWRFPLRVPWMHLLAPLVLRKVRPHVVHLTNYAAPLFKEFPTVMNLHDMTLHLFPELHPLRRRLTRPLMLGVARRADALITDSESARRDVLRLLKVPPDRLHLIPAAPAPEFRPIEDRDYLESVRRRYHLPERFILFVGTIEPRKNLPRLMAAVAEIRRRLSNPPHLVLVGALGWGVRDLTHGIESLGLQESILLPGYVPYPDLPAFYNLCEVFVYPSLYEGFGLPVLEAMACGAPAVTSNDSSLGEIAGSAAALVDPRDTEALTQSLERLLTEADWREELRRRGLKRAAEFSWERTAREVLALYSRVAGRL